ncbi:S8 family peptidase [Algoriphagus lutimaris]|uniref:S8 family peptidase n=1 Tax=Algoriphagus lutimaris TaxID=613197 RepID=UPI00196A4BB3|nr:S8 family peptidase [Algoriphagus lutimaris]MBN3520283.1 S8 family peptidase [Algoriphagus lutimaris]
MKTLKINQKWHAILIVFAFASCDLQIDQVQIPQDEVLSQVNKPSLIPDKYIVVLKEETLNFRKTGRYEDVQAGMRVISNDLAARHGVSSNKIEKVYGNVINGFSAELTSEQARLLAEDPKVAYIEQDGYAYGSDVVQTGATWGLDRINQAELPLDGEYSYNSPGSDITAYILDSGIRYDHEEFEGRATPGIDFYGGNASDVFGHGTHVAGTVGGSIYGVAKKVKLVSVKVLGDNNRGSWSNIIGGIDWVSANKTGPSVINMSIQGYSFGNAVSNAVKSAFNNGIVVVVAAGNWNENACWQALASVPEAISVGATNDSDSRAGFSNYGSCIDIFAPGVNITSASVSGPDQYVNFQGTSMAAPHVAGAAVLYLSKNPTATPQEVTDYLMENATVGVVTNSNSANNNLLFNGKIKPNKGKKK